MKGHRRAAGGRESVKDIVVISWVVR